MPRRGGSGQGVTVNAVCARFVNTRLLDRDDGHVLAQVAAVVDHDVERSEPLVQRHQEAHSD